MRLERQRAVEQVTAVEQVEDLADRDRVDGDGPCQWVRSALSLHPEERAERVSEERQADEDDAPDPEAGQNRSVHRAGRPLHDIEFMRLEGDHQPQGDRGHHVHPEHLRRRDRQGEAEEDCHRDHERLGDVGRQEKEDRLLDVVVHGATFLHCRADRGKVVVGEDHSRRLLGHFGAFDAHRDADVRLLERRRIVHAISGHRHGLPIRLDGLHQPQLVLRARPRKDIDLAHGLLERRFVHLLDFAAGDSGRAVADSEHLGDGGRRDLVVAGDHGDADAAAVALLHGVDRFLAGRVEQTDQAKQDEILREVGGAEAARLEAGTLQPRQREHTFALARELVRDLRKSLAIERRAFPVAHLLPIAMIEDDLGCAFDQETLLSLGILVERRHELVLRFEWDGVNARVRRLFRPPVHPEFGGEGVEGALGRIPFDLPGAVFLEKLGIVAEHRDAAQQPEHRILAVGGLPFLLDLAFGGIAVAGDLVLGLGGGGRHHHHFHQGQCAGLVGTDA